MALSPAIAPSYAPERDAGDVPWPLLLLVAGVTSSAVGGLWDISWHMTIGRDTFWTPAHIAIYLGGTTGGLAGAWLALRMTFLSGEAGRSDGIGLFGCRAPLGAWIAMWGALAMLASGPFDNWWHNAYGLDVKIISPPHVVLFTGSFSIRLGVWLMLLREQNRAARPGLAAWLFCYIGAVMIMDTAVLHLTEFWPHRQHSQAFFFGTALEFPCLLVLISRASKLRWGATLAAAGYMLFVAAVIWILPLFAATPRLGPIYNPVTHMRAPPFPLWLIVPAVAVDLLQHSRLGSGRGWLRELLLAAAVGAVFLGLYLPVQWSFASFYISPASANAFFGGDRIWAYTFNRPEDLHRFWTDENGWAAGSVLPALATASVSALVGSWLGRLMARVRR
jgi:hypothetical protein